MIRAAVEADAGSIAAIWNPIIRDTAITFTSVEKEPGEIARMIAARPAFLVLEREGAVAGFATMGTFRSGPGYAHIQEHTILLAPAARGAGHGRALMRALEAAARGQGFAALIGGVSGSNPGAVAFHAALGFEPVGRVPRAGHKFGAWHDLVLMHKFL